MAITIKVTLRGNHGLTDKQFDNFKGKILKNIWSHVGSSEALAEIYKEAQPTNFNPDRKGKKDARIADKNGEGSDWEKLCAISATGAAIECFGEHMRQNQIDTLIDKICVFITDGDSQNTYKSHPHIDAFAPI